MITADFILTLYAHGGKVRPKTLYLLLTAKKTSSTLMYGFITETLAFWGLGKTLTENQYQTLLQHLIQKKWLVKPEPDFIQITADGQRQCQKRHATLKSLTALNGLRFGKDGGAFWDDLLFLTQIASHFTAPKSPYIPVEGNRLRQQKMSQWLKRLGFSKKQLAMAIYEEWRLLLNLIPPEAAATMTLQFTGKQQTGCTLQQLRELSPDRENFLWWLQNYQHCIFQEIIRRPTIYPVFFELLSFKGFFQMNPKLLKTVSLYQRGKAVKEIAEISQLRPGTIIDYLTEWGIIDGNFDLSADFQPYLKELQAFEKVYALNEWAFHDFYKIYPQVPFAAFRFYQISKIHAERRLVL